MWIQDWIIQKHTHVCLSSKQFLVIIPLIRTWVVFLICTSRVLVRSGLDVYEFVEFRINTQLYASARIKNGYIVVTGYNVTG